MLLLLLLLTRLLRIKVRVELLHRSLLLKIFVVLWLRIPPLKSSKDFSQTSRTCSLLETWLILEVVDSFIGI